jgi:T3SS negative regulator,GrlR
MQNGLYKVEFQTPLGAGAGVIILQDGKIQGGDSAMYYIGGYSENGQELTARVEGKLHTNMPGMSSVFGINHTHIKLTGRTNGNSAVMQGRADEAPNVSFQAKLTKLH